MHQPVERLRIVRLNNGDDIIGIVKECEGGIYISDPIKIVYVIPPDDSIGSFVIAFSPWVFRSICENQTFLIKDRDILFSSDPSPKFYEYHKAFKEEVNKDGDILHDMDQEEEETPKSIKVDRSKLH